MDPKLVCGQSKIWKFEQRCSSFKQILTSVEFKPCKNKTAIKDLYCKVFAQTPPILLNGFVPNIEALVFCHIILQRCNSQEAASLSSECFGLL